ncbi:hypothetical protein FA95DRAFT_1606803 [Auriscalpium vulgare]|uniref:Uncharacterized protein n=1 Tax=Auriscalpium vulgare TaxID=40419 RepID=A0ACB8RR01_9AGAM|nr:hypothetical protein FA95DRAFT_1606803 [Auriscalpium vulgare]
MAFFSSSGSEVNELRLKRSTSFDRLHARSRRPSRSAASPPAPAPALPSITSSTSRPAKPFVHRGQPPSPLPRSLRSGPGHVLAALEPPHSPYSLEHYSDSSGSSQRRSSNHTKSKEASPSRTKHQLIAEDSKRSHNVISTSGRPTAHQRMPDEFGEWASPRQSTVASSPYTPSSNKSSSSRPLGPYSGSVSDSGMIDRSPHRFDYPSPSSSRPKTHLSPLDARHGPPLSPGHITSGSLSDGGSPSERASSPLLAHQLDVKRLLSKPAAPSRASMYSITSDSDSPGPAGVRSAPLSGPSSTDVRWPSMANESRNVRRRSTGASLILADFDAEANRSRLLSTNVAMSNASPTSASTAAKDKVRQRNVLRKNSASAPRRPGPSSAPPTNMAIPEARNSSNSSPSTSASRLVASQLAVLSRRSSPASAVSSQGSGSGASRSPQPTPVSTPKLTPAGAIARAYKEQDQRRETLAAAARQEDIIPAQRARGGDERADVEDEQPSTPYYTVFGSTSGRVVAVGSAEDAAWTSVAYATSTRSGSASAPASMRRSLSRKVSGRFRRSKTTESSGTPSDGHDGGRRGRPSLQERRSTSLPKEGRKSLRVSTDSSYVEVDFPAAQSVPSLSSGKRADSGKSTPENSPASGRGKEKEDETSSGGRLWKLVKRISSSGLRDRYSSGPSTPPPPVPAIPKDLLPLPTRATLEVHSPAASMSVDRGAVNRYMDSRASMSAVRPPTTPLEKPPPGKTKRPSIGTKTGRPSTSPSQSSSDVALRFFDRTQSARSSSSSYGEELPPVPPYPTSRQGSPAQESPRALDEVRSPRPRKSHAKHATVDARGSPPSATLPARRGTSSERTRPDSRSSPDIPMFSVSDAVNNFVARKPTISTPERPPLRIVPPPIPQTDALASSSVPPRPPRSTHRPTTTPPAASPTTTTAATSAFPNTPMALLNPDRSEVASPAYRHRDSIISGHSDASTARPTPSSIERSPAVAQVTFRELDSSPRQAWTQKQKEDKWDDLLERSALAGGTLHLGDTGGLLSDTIRFSGYSDI